ncbi:metallophosphoesterase [Candidatus Pacearchaeota archaeon]|nr:metallophosphoesterase [Candidatus Pacearchaeota archaeon]
MKILVIGDFHGKLHKKIKKLIKKEKPEVILSIGDYLPFHYRKLWFKHSFGTDIELWQVIGKKRYKKIILRDLDEGEKVLKELNKFNIPVFTVLGNVDYPDSSDVMDEELPKNFWKWEYSRKAQFANRLRKYKNIRRIDYTFAKFRDFVFIGARGHSFPGRPGSKAFKKHKKILEKLFKKFKKENKSKKVIFISHNVPFRTKLDIITDRKANKLVRSKHAGSKLIRKIIDKYHPILHLAGHVHEGRGFQKLGRTLCINCGDACKGQYALIDIKEGDSGKMHVRLKMGK